MTTTEPRHIGTALSSLRAQLEAMRARAAASGAVGGARADEAGPRPCPICGGAGWLRGEWADGAHGRERELLRCACKLEDDRLRIWREARVASGLPPLLDTFTFEHFVAARQPTAYRAAQDFAADPNRHWLVLFGGVGTGKTHLLAAVAHALLAARAYPAYRVVTDLFEWLKEGMGDDAYAARLGTIQDAQVLLLDDLGVEQGTPWQRQKLYDILNHRLAHDRPTAIATNVDPAELPERLASRLLDRGRVRVVTMRPGDYRRRVVKGEADRERRRGKGHE